MIAYCYADGWIGFTQRRREPAGSWRIVKADGRRMRPIVRAIAQCGGNGRMLVPGMSEATTSAAAGEAFKAFQGAILKRLAAGGRA